MIQPAVTPCLSQRRGRFAARPRPPRPTAPAPTSASAAASRSLEPVGPPSAAPSTSRGRPARRRSSSGAAASAGRPASSDPARTAPAAPSRAAAPASPRDARTAPDLVGRLGRRRRRASTPSASDPSPRTAPVARLPEIRRPDARAADTRIPRTSGRASSSATRQIGSVEVGRFGSVRWRVIVRNVESRIFTCTVAALRPAARSRPATPSAMASSVRSIVSRSLRVDVERVLVADRLRGLGLGVHRVVVDARARDRAGSAPCFPNRRTSRSTGSAASSPSVRTPYSRSAAAVCSPDAPQPRDRQRREERRLLARLHDDQTVGLAQVRRDLRNELGRRDADATPSAASPPRCRP